MDIDPFTFLNMNILPCWALSLEKTFYGFCGKKFCAKCLCMPACLILICAETGLEKNGIIVESRREEKMEKRKNGKNGRIFWHFYLLESRVIWAAGKSDILKDCHAVQQLILPDFPAGRNVTKFFPFSVLPFFWLFPARRGFPQFFRFSPLFGFNLCSCNITKCR